KAGRVRETSLFREALRELKKPHLHLYLLIFTLWWFMFPMLWDVLPKFVEDWVDTREIVRSLFGAEGARHGVVRFLLGMKEDGLKIEPEGIVNINSRLLYETHHIGTTWYFFAAIGLVSAGLIWTYGKWLRNLAAPSAPKSQLPQPTNPS
ncbi:MAG: hypothetical protein RLZZ522_2219, partial [Verrucomicrobiota bacterium]